MKAGILGMAFLGAVAGGLPPAVHADSGGMPIVVGAGGGALLGQAIGRNTESTLVGAAIGGIAGALVGMEPRHDNRVYYERPVEYRTTVVQPVQPRMVYVYVNDRDNDHHRHKNDRHWRHSHNRWERPERVVVVRDWDRPGRYR